jgi:hypothetical protein
MAIKLSLKKKAKVSVKICRYRIRGVLTALIFMRGAVFAWTFAKICTIFVVYEGDFMKKRRFSVAVAIFAVALAFSGCDFLLPPVEEEEPETYGDLVIKGTSDEGKKIVVVTISTKRGPVSKTIMPSPKDHDSYVIKVDNVLYSEGEVMVDGTGTVVTFIPKEEGLQSFRATLDIKDITKPSLKFFDPEIPTRPKTIKGYQSDFEIGEINPTANAIAALLNKSGKTNAEVIGDNVVINGRIELVDESITIPDTIILIFNSRDYEPFTISENIKTEKATVIAKGGIDVSRGRGLTLESPVSLVVEKKSEFEGRLIVEGGATLDIAEDVTIKKGGVLDLAGGDTVRGILYVKQYPPFTPPPDPSPNFTTGTDAILKLRGNLTINEGGRLQMPDPLWFFSSNTKNNITGSITVKSGGELVLVTATPKGDSDLHPWIGTVYTATQGAPVGADFVMYPDTNPDGKIVIRNSSGSPALELSGTATALGRLILDTKNYNPNKDFHYNNDYLVYDEDNDIWNFDHENYGKNYVGGYYQDAPYYRLEVWLTYPFKVTKGSFLSVGNSTEYFLRSSLFVTGMSYPKLNNFDRGIYYKGVLTNDGTIIVYEKNGILEWFGGYLDHKGAVNGFDGEPIEAKLGRLAEQFVIKSGEKGDVDVKAWSPNLMKDFVAIPDPDKWWPPWFNDLKKPYPDPDDYPLYNP